MTACVPARFPELSRTMTRSPRRSNTVILQNLAMLSMPALVRESEREDHPLVEPYADAVGHAKRLKNMICMTNSILPVRTAQ